MPIISIVPVLQKSWAKIPVLEAMDLARLTVIRFRTLLASSPYLAESGDQRQPHDNQPNDS